jgi:uncharacterized damage-inducible protein DinB
LVERYLLVKALFVNGGNMPTSARFPADSKALATLKMLVRYKAWADERAFDAVTAIPEEEALKPRMTTFKNMVHTLNHVFVVDDIFRHHLTGRTHGYTARNTESTPRLSELWNAAQSMDRWYIQLVDGWFDDDLSEVVRFEFVGGGAGAMTKEEIILHIVNHTTYHRGFVGDLLRQVPYSWPANDLSVFIRDVYRVGASG